ncbi:dihydrofolate reductase [Sediminicola sp. 1XM1-17]|uniref:dihydrofolate reductase n=1 Tax=Sediminicola sp. 1XM1-17 TaxID=3127702 RepID=UPI003077DE00
MIAAVAENNALGKDNDLLWHLPDDFKRFKTLTTGHKIVMGRKTFESFPKPLPNRHHIIITRDKDYHVEHPNCTIVHSLGDALDLVKGEDTSFIIGGGEIYTLAMPFCDVLEVTRVHGTYDADAYFPTIDPSVWTLEREEYHAKDEKHAVDFTYRTFIRKGI